MIRMEDGLATKFSSAEKRHKQDEKRRVQNKKVKSSVRTAAKKVVAAAHAKDKVLAETTLKDMIKQIDTAARKGIFITTSGFSKDARDYVASIDSKVILIDGEELAKLMIDHGIGVTEVASYVVKRTDSDYFGQE